MSCFSTTALAPSAAPRAFLGAAHPRWQLFLATWTEVSPSPLLPTPPRCLPRPQLLLTTSSRCSTDGDLDIVVGNDGATGNSNAYYADEANELLPNYYYAGQANELLLNDGLGTFSRDSSFLGGYARTRSLALGDVNGDGALDIIVGNGGAECHNYCVDNYGPDELLLNNGSGSFKAHPDVFDTGLNRQRRTEVVALADVDGDGDLDLFVGRYGLANDLFLNDGLGRFSVVTDFPGRAGGKSTTKAVSFGDVDGDGDLDALVGNIGEDVLMLNDGSGNFSVATFQSGTSCAFAVAFADVDGDGDLDALVGNKLMLGGSLGGFAADRTFDGGVMDTKAVALGDVDGDGDLDIILGSVEGSELLINDGTGSYSKDARFPGWITHGHAIVCGDVDGDGDLDIVFGNGVYYGGPNQLLINDGSGGFSARILPGGSAVTTSLAFADLDADGDLDLLVGNCPSFGQEDTTGANLLLLNDGTGEFTVDSNFPGSSTHRALTVAFGDLNGDGTLDIFIGNGDNLGNGNEDFSTNQILLNQGSGSFIEDTSFDGGNACTRGAALGDADGDGDLDILLGTNGAPNELLLNDGSGGFSSASTMDFPSTTTPGVAVTFLDVDADGALDILIGNDDFRANTLLRNDGSGSFSIDLNFDGGSGSTYAVALGDVDLDGDLDLIVVNQGGNELLLYTHCPSKGAQLHAASACFGCPPFMGRHSPSMCLECLPDVAAMGVIGTGESCSISCTLGQRPLGSDVCQYCKEVPGTSYDSSLPDRVSTDPATWAAPRCADCSSGTMADPVTGAVCLPCLPGQYTADAASVNCTACPPGSFSSGTSSTSCELCPVGGFCASVGAATASMTFEQCPGARACVLRCARPMHLRNLAPPARQLARTTRSPEQQATAPACSASLERPTRCQGAVMRPSASTANRARSRPTMELARVTSAWPGPSRTRPARRRAIRAWRARTVRRARRQRCRAPKARTRARLG